MNSGPTLVFVALVLSACVGVQITPSVDTVQQYRDIAVVAIEPPPLSIPNPLIAETIGSMVVGGPAYIVLGSILIATQLPESMKHQARIVESVDAALVRGDVWIPTAALAQEVGRQLSTPGVRRVTVRPGFLAIPGVTDKERSYFMENWMRPIRTWYNTTSTASRYREMFPEPIDVVLEVGISNFEVLGAFHDGEPLFLIQVMVKLIDPVTGSVVGRARSAANSRIPKIDTLVTDDAKALKEVIVATARGPVTTSLRALGFTSVPR